MASNIDVFDSAVAAILAYLYETFPRSVVLNAYALAGESSDEVRDAYADTVAFLQREGFLTYHSRAGSGGMFANVVLTARGLELLRATPSSLQAKVPLGEQLGTAVKSGAKEVAKGLGKMLGQAVTSPEAWHAITRTTI